MKKNDEILCIDYGQVDFSPAVIDYDFQNRRPRGGSCRIDFFSHGMLSASLEGVDFEDKVYIKKDNIFFDNGIFLLDFKHILEKPEIFIEMINNMKYSKVYLENSVQYNILRVAEQLADVEVILMNFGCIK